MRDYRRAHNEVAVNNVLNTRWMLGVATFKAQPSQRIEGRPVDDHVAQLSQTADSRSASNIAQNAGVALRPSMRSTGMPVARTAAGLTVSSR